MRHDAEGLFWHDLPPVRAGGTRGPRERGPMPAVPATGWRTPTEFPNLNAAKVIGFDTETYDPELLAAGPGWGRGKGHIIGASLSVEDGTSWYFPVRHGIEDGQQILPPEHAAMNMDPQNVLAFLRHSLGDTRPKVGANLIYDVGWLAWEGVPVNGPLFDIQFAEALLNSEAPDVSLDNLGERYVGEGKTSEELYNWLAMWCGGAANDKQRKNLYLTPPCLAGPYAEGDASLPIRILNAQWPLMAARGVLDLFHLECRLIPLLVAMRLKGTPINLAKTEEVYDRLGGEMAIMEGQLKDIAGMEVNPNAQDSIKAAFTKLGLEHPQIKDKKTGLMRTSFSASVLEEVHHPLSAKILEWRQTGKVKNVFLKSYIMDKHVNGRVFCSFHPLKGTGGGTRSGRFSCVAEWTPVPTLAGTKRMADVVVGDYVWTHKGRWQKVLATYIKPADEMYRVVFSNGEEITCTAGHRLLTEKGWEKLNEYAARCGIQITGSSKMGGQPERPARAGCGNIQASRTSNDCASLRRVPQASGSFFAEHDRILGAEDGYTRDGIQGAEGYALQRQQDRGQEPDAGEMRRGAPQLYRGHPRGTGEDGALHAKGRRYVLPPESHCILRDARNTGADVRGTRSGSAPYQREGMGRSTGQPSALQSSGTCDNTRYATSDGHPYVKEINACGSYEVYDITVAEDASYFACGVFNHNSSDPNLQNIPVRSAIGKLVRQVFMLHFAGGRWRSFDYSSIEYRLLAHFATGPGSDEIRAIYAQNPKADYHKIVGDLIERLTGLALERGKVKTINFGIIYGMALNALALALHLPRPQASKLLDDYHAAAPYARDTMDMCAKEVHQTGQVRTIMNRVSDFTWWGPKAYQNGPRQLALPYEAACAKWGMFNIEIQNTHKALNRKLQGSAADVMKKGMVDAWEAGLFAEDACGVPILTVHDELDFEDYGDPEAECWKELKYIMEHCMDDKLRVPLLVDSSFGDSWGACK